MVNNQNYIIFSFTPIINNPTVPKIIDIIPNVSVCRSLSGAGYDVLLRRSVFV